MSGKTGSREKDSEKRGSEERGIAIKREWRKKDRKKEGLKKELGQKIRRGKSLVIINGKMKKERWR